MVFFSFIAISNSDSEYLQASRVDLYADSPLVGSFSFFRSDLVGSFYGTLHLPIGLGKVRATCCMLETPFCPKVSEFC